MERDSLVKSFAGSLGLFIGAAFVVMLRGAALEGVQRERIAHQKGETQAAALAVIPRSTRQLLACSVVGDAASP
jgi:hypothetical protein